MVVQTMGIVVIGYFSKVPNNSLHDNRQILTRYG